MAVIIVSLAVPDATRTVKMVRPVATEAADSAVAIDRTPLLSVGYTVCGTVAIIDEDGGEAGRWRRVPAAVPGGRAA